MTPDRLLEHYGRIADAPDAVGRLRRFVLDLAVRGKLVPQDPADEPASELLKRSKKQAPGSALKASRTDKNEAATPEYDLPSNWLWVRIGDHLELVNGMAFKPTDWQQAGIKIVRIQNLNRLDAPFNYCDPNHVRDRFLINDGAFLISWSGTPGTSFGAFIWDRGEAVLNQHIFRCDFRIKAFCPLYLRLAINGRLDEMIAKAHGGVGLQHITKGKLEALLIALPPLAEQHRIVAKVDELMTLCDRLEAARAEREATRNRLAAASLARLNAPDPETFTDDARFALNALPALTTRPDQIKQLRQTILNLAVRGKLVPQDPADEPASGLLKRIAMERAGPQAVRKARRNGEADVSSLRADTSLANDWRWTNIEEVALSMRYGTSTKCEYTTPGVPVLRIPNVSGGVVSLDDIKFGPLTEAENRDLALNAGDILMIRSNGSLDIVGRAAVVPPTAAGMAFAGYLVRLRLSLSNIKPEYVWLALNSTDVRDQIERPIRSAVVSATSLL